MFGPRGAIYVVRRKDIAVFTRGLLPRDRDRLARIDKATRRVHAILDGNAMRKTDLIAALSGVGGMSDLRWATTTGTIGAAWDAVDTIVHPIRDDQLDAEAARMELARRFFCYLGPATVKDLRWWLAGTQADAAETVRQLGDELVTVSVNGRSCLVTRTSSPLFDTGGADRDRVHLLPPDDVYIGRTNRELLVPDITLRQLLWPKAPPPGALVVGGNVCGTWRRRRAIIAIAPWLTIGDRVRAQVESIAGQLPLPPTDSENQVRWLDPV